MFRAESSTVIIAGHASYIGVGKGGARLGRNWLASRGPSTTGASAPAYAFATPAFGRGGGGGAPDIVRLHVTVPGGIVDPYGPIGQQIVDALIPPLRRALDRNR